MGHEEIINVNSANDVITSFSGHELLHCICKEAASAVRRISRNLKVWDIQIYLNPPKCLNHIIGVSMCTYQYINFHTRDLIVLF